MKKKTFLLGAATVAAAITTSCTSTTEESQQEQVSSVEIAETPEPQESQPDTIKGSIPSEATGSIGNADIKINYHAPGVKGRIIWGGLVPYNQVWVTGAHMATSFETDKALIIDGKELPAGKYALFTIPGKNEWTVIFNRDWQQHLADKYDQKKDVLRVQVKPEELKQHQERLKYEILGKNSSEGDILIAWDKVGLTVPVRSNS
ncbi:DUF2911 domain-containing protein [Pontibacter mangrovi]|uniref:DUF2911 domain-containing protein n=2 Tax=Pseudomonadati TaxID=3379134 RepID=A0A501WJM9_9RHOB|nr:DUF2911 domain-containing protein [Pontibacter mangrovi]TPE41514.1 DUF2911 domain-containing protein [Pontibacter mangrovi]TPE48645.1 DUF2911 domain-containing protein [Amaricoccus solimangrovi]